MAAIQKNSREVTTLTRRDVLTGSAAALVAGSIDASAQDGAKQTRVRVIDVHAHWYPPEWLALMEKEGDANGAKMSRNARGLLVATIPGLSVTFQPQYTDIATRLAAMDKAGVAMHALSLTQPVAFWAPPAFGLKLCQTYNDACVALHQKYPDRFVGLAMLPMQDPALAVKELDRVATLRGIRGIYMATHINGKNLNQKEYWPVYARAQEVGLPILLHPVNPVGADRMRDYYLRNFIGNPTEAALAAASFIFSGAFDDFPTLDVVLPHAGGVFPQLIGRWEHGATVRAHDHKAGAACAHGRHGACHAGRATACATGSTGLCHGLCHGGHSICHGHYLIDFAKVIQEPDRIDLCVRRRVECSNPPRPPQGP